MLHIPSFWAKYNEISKIVLYEKFSQGSIMTFFWELQSWQFLTVNGSQSLTENFWMMVQMIHHQVYIIAEYVQCAETSDAEICDSATQHKNCEKQEWSGSQ